MQRFHRYDIHEIEFVLLETMMFVSTVERKESTMNEIRLNLAKYVCFIVYTYIYIYYKYIYIYYRYVDPFVRWTIVVTQFNTIRLCPLFFCLFFFS